VTAASPPLRLTPVYRIARRLGARFAEQDGWRIAEVYTGLEAEVSAAQRGVVLADETPNGKLSIEGLEAAAVVRETLETTELAVGDGAATWPDSVYRLRADLFFVSTPPDGVRGARDRLTAQASDRFVTVTDITHGRSEVRLIGPSTRELLSRLCALDLHPSVFPDRAVRQTSVAKTTQMVIRRDIGATTAFTLIGPRSLGAYLWDAIVQAGQDLGIVPAGSAAVRSLAGNR
jgi:heterotetrameric sarcosine oxidase gamma subunit